MKGLQPNASRRARGRSRKSANRTQCASENRPANYSPAFGTESLRRRGSNAFVANLFGRRSLVRRQLLLVHAPQKILIPHSTTTMADTSVAAVSTFSMEATLILFLR